MKRTYLGLFSSLCLLLLTGFQFFGINQLQHSSGPDAGHSGDPAYGYQTCANCHFGSSPRIFDTVITSNIPSAGYVPNMTYTIQVKIREAGITKYGFQISPQNVNGDFLGKLIASDKVKTQLNPDDDRYINHTYQGVDFPGGTGQWSFQWTAPERGSGPVTFYGAFLLSNDSDTPIGDKVVTSTLNVEENMVSSLSILPSNPQSTEISLFPNPSHENLTCSFQLDQKATKVTFSILQNDGKIVYSRFQEALTATDHLYTFPVSRLPKGLYYLHIKGEGIQATKSFLKN